MKSPFFSLFMLRNAVIPFNEFINTILVSLARCSSWHSPPLFVTQCQETCSKLSIINMCNPAPNSTDLYIFLSINNLHLPMNAFCSHKPYHCLLLHLQQHTGVTFCQIYGYSSEPSGSISLNLAQWCRKVSQSECSSICTPTCASLSLLDPTLLYLVFAKSSKLN